MTRIIWQRSRKYSGALHRAEDRILRPEFTAAGRYRGPNYGGCGSGYKRLGVAVKCATITPNAQRMKEYNLKQMWKSPTAHQGYFGWNGFRTHCGQEYQAPGENWRKPITIARHAYGDVYKDVEYRVMGPARRIGLLQSRARRSGKNLPVHRAGSHLGHA